jgi:hypothetical protein
MKGEYDALEQSAIQKKCSVAKEIAAAKAMEEKRVQKQEDAAKRSGQSMNQ